MADQRDPEPYPNAFAASGGSRSATSSSRIPGSKAVTRTSRDVGLPSIRQRQQTATTHRPRSDLQNEEYLKLTIVGRGLEDMIEDSFFFDPIDQNLYVKIAGEPAWYSIEVGVRGFVLTRENIHDVVIRGLELRHNRQPGGQWSMVTFGQCERVVMEDCRSLQSDFCGLGLGGPRTARPPVRPVL